MRNFRRNTNYQKFVYNLKNLNRLFLKKNFRKYYSQDGEDIILEDYLAQRKNGFYIDVGAHHPKRFSNTYLFYKKGWNGINIDPLPGSMRIFNLIRKRDINLEIGISKKKSTLTYYMFNEPALNGFSKSLSEHRESEGIYNVIDKKDIKTYPLSEILKKYLPEGVNIDFLSIDAEGMDLDVLKSNDWKKYSPLFVLVECIGVSLDDISADLSYKFLKNEGYKLIAKTFRTCIFEKVK